MYPRSDATKSGAIDRLKVACKECVCERPYLGGVEFHKVFHTSRPPSPPWDFSIRGAEAIWLFFILHIGTWKVQSSFMAQESVYCNKLYLLFSPFSSPFFSPEAQLNSISHCQVKQGLGHRKIDEGWVRSARWWNKLYMLRCQMHLIPSIHRERLALELALNLKWQIEASTSASLSTEILRLQL